MKVNNLYILIGYLLLAVFLIQEIFDLRLRFLLDLQQEQSFRRWSGLFLATFILLQWSLTLVRVIPRWEEKALTFQDIHKWMGALSPLAFYIHAMKFGFAYLFLLSTVFFANVALGFVNTDVIRSRAEWYMQGWMIAHVAFSLLISMLMLYHVWVVFYYE